MQSLAIDQSDGVRVPGTARTLAESARREIGGVTRLYARAEGSLPDVKGGRCKRQGRRLTTIETTSHYSSYVNYKMPIPNIADQVFTSIDPYTVWAIGLFCISNLNPIRTGSGALIITPA